MKKLSILVFSFTVLLWSGSAMASHWNAGSNECGSGGYDCGDNPLKNFMDVKSGDVKISVQNSASWLFDLDNDALKYGDVGAEDTIVKAELDIDIFGWGSAKFTILNDGDGFVLNDKKNIFIFRDVEYNVLAGLLGNHLLNVTVENSRNICDWDMLVTNVSLTGKYCDVSTPAPVPEPATMLLFGTGLVGLIGSRFRKKK